MTETLIDYFVGGLKPNIQRDVIAQSPTTLVRCASLAKLYEEKYSPRSKPAHYSAPLRSPSSPYNITSSQSI